MLCCGYKFNSKYDAIKINLYRILQEALQNIIKYADATYVEIKISLNNNNLYIAQSW